jgi:hypothetical protein
MRAMRPDPLERAAGVALPVAGYPLYEQALRRQLGHPSPGASMSLRASFNLNVLGSSCNRMYL